MLARSILNRMPPDPSPAPAPEIENVTQEARLLIRTHARAQMVVWMIPLAWMIGVLYLFYFVIGDHAIISLNANDGTAILLFFPLFIPLFYYSNLNDKARELLIGQIAQSFGYTYVNSAPFDISGTIFTRDPSHAIREVMSGAYRDMPLRIFTYLYTVHAGKSSHAVYDAVAELTYPAELPHIVLVRKISLSSVGDTAPFSSSIGLEKVELEGDFDTYFSLYVEQGAQVKIREIFQPDLMQWFIDHFADHDLEVNGTKIYLLQRGQLSSRKEYVALHTLADAVTDKLLPGLAQALQK